MILVGYAPKEKEYLVNKSFVLGALVFAVGVSVGAAIANNNYDHVHNIELKKEDNYGAR